MAYLDENGLEYVLDKLSTEFDKKSNTGHTHDDRYYTESEIDSKVSTLNTAINKKMGDFTIEIYNGTGGNPKPVRFASFNYSTCVSEEGIAAKISLVSGHGNGTSYAFLEDAIIRVNYQGNVEVDNFKYYGQSCGTYDGEVRQYGDIFWVVDTTNKVVDFYVLMGQYARVQQTPWKRLTYSSKGAVTQYTSCTVYSSGTKNWANNDEIATKNDIPEGQDLSKYAVKATTIEGYGITDAYTKTQVDSQVATLNNSINGKATKATTLSGYGITDAYTKTQVDSALSGKANSSHGNHVPATQAASNSVFLRNDNTWATVTPGNIGTYTKAEIDSALAGKQASGSYAASSHGHDAATTSAAGFMSASDKSKLDGIATGANKTTVDSSLSGTSTNPVQNKVVNSALAGKASTTDLSSHTGNTSNPHGVTAAQVGTYTKTEIDNALAGKQAAGSYASSSHTHSAYVNQNAFSNVTVGSTTIAADTATDTLTLVGSNVTLTPDATNDKLTIGITKTNVTDALGYIPPTTNTTYNAASQSAAGLMSADDKKKLDGIASGAQVNSVTGVKGNSESSYRTGQVNITAANIGLGNVSNTSDANKPVSTAQQTAIDNALSSAKTYADEIKNDLLNGAGAAYDTLKELGDLIVANDTAIDALETVASGKADANHTHSAYVNQNAFSKVTVGSTTIESDNATDTLTLAGSNVTLTPDATNDKVTIGITKANVTNALGYTPPTTNTTYGVVSTTADGLAPKRDGSTSKFLRGDGTWATPPNTTYSDATTSASGLMSSGDKSKLNGIATGAEVNQNAFANVTVGSTTIAADAKSDTLTIAAGSNVTITPDATNDKITIAATNTTYNAATTSAAGLMSASDKSKLDGIATGANAYSLPTASSSTLGGVKTTSSVTSTSGLTACPIISGVPYYKDTTYSTLRNPYALTIGLTGDGTSVSYDGSQLKSINITAASVGAAASNHSHNDIYYTETEIDTKISNLSSVIDTKASSSHVHDKLVISQQSDNGTKIKTISLSSPTEGTKTYLALQPHITDSSLFSGTLLGTTTNPFSRIYANAITITGNADITGTLDVDRAVTLGTTLKTNGITTVLARIQPDLESSSGGVVNLGYSNANNRWSNIYSKTAVNTGSDLRIKKNISEIDDRYIKLFDLIQPYAYQFVDGTSGRYHTGFISQYVEEAMAQVGLEDTDVAFFCKDAQFKETKDEEGNVIGSEPVLDENGNQEYFYSLRYEEYIAIMTAKIKQLESKLDKMEELEARLAKLEA